MIGLLDSGMGGENTLAELRKIAPLADVILLKDGKNAPYGTKGRDELVRIVAENIRTLTERGADSVLIACCTASCICDMLPARERNASYPIIEDTAEAAMRVTENGRIAVIATEGTVNRRAFSSRLGGACGAEIQAGELVELIEGGVSDRTASEGDILKIRRILEPLSAVDCDTLILGCTHFPSLEETIRREAEKFGIKNIVSSAGEGARAMLRACPCCTCGEGVTVRIET